MLINPLSQIDGGEAKLETGDVMDVKLCKRTLNHPLLHMNLNVSLNSTQF